MAIGGGTVALIALTASFTLAILVLLTWSRRRDRLQPASPPSLAPDPESHLFASSASTSLQDEDDEDAPRQRMARPMAERRPARCRVATGATSATKSSLRGSIRRAWESLGLPHRTLVGGQLDSPGALQPTPTPERSDATARWSDEAPLSSVTERTEASSREPDFGWKR